ncbi:MAG: hypothetical protein ACK55F_12430 [Acidobacteriota bacterium]
MPSKELTDEQRQRRAAIARQNGAKSKGPVTVEGKYRSSMNTIATGEHVELHKEDLPPFFFLLSTDDRSAYLRAFQAQMRHLKPQSDFEQGLVRRMAIALFQHDRLTNFQAEAMQREVDTIVREFPALGLSDHFFLSNKRATLDKEVQQFVIRGQRHHMATFRSLHKTLIDLRRHTPMQPPEPVDITADSQQIRDDDPDPAVAVEVLALADRAKKEPNFDLPGYVLNLLQDNDLMERLAPGHDVGDLLERFGRTPVPKAA